MFRLHRETPIYPMGVANVRQRTKPAIRFILNDGLSWGIVSFCDRGMVGKIFAAAVFSWE
ncbi:MAG TPA: hypothetical protein DEO95_10665 [Ruminococcaceae bacterium]|nr:hypothetical protein [Oscillospiraceae bacterium]